MRNALADKYKGSNKFDLNEMADSTECYELLLQNILNNIVPSDQAASNRSLLHYILELKLEVYTICKCGKNLKFEQDKDQFVIWINFSFLKEVMHIDTSDISQYNKAKAYLDRSRGKLPEFIKQIYPHTLVMINEQEHIKECKMA